MQITLNLKKKLEKTANEFFERAKKALLRYPWEGNVREPSLRDGDDIFSPERPSLRRVQLFDLEPVVDRERVVRPCEGSVH